MANRIGLSREHLRQSLHHLPAPCAIGHAMSQSDPPVGTWSHWLTDKAIRSAIGLAHALPYRARVAFMGALTRRVIGPMAGYKARSMTNLQRIWPELDFAARRRIASEVNDNLGRTLIENYSSSDLARHLANTQATGAGLAPLAQARADGRAVIFVTAHFGNYEAPRHVLTRMGYTIGGLYKPMSNPYFNDHYVKTMQDISGPVFEKGPSGTRGFVRFLKAGGMATLLFDVSEPGADRLPFLGHPAKTSLAAATFALKFDALLIPYFGTRRNGTEFDVEIEAPIPHTSALDMTLEMTRRLEARVTDTPSQWFWVHRRWK